MSRRWFRLLVVVLAATALFACSSSNLTDDARVTSCQPGTDTEKPRATGQIENSSSKTSNFFIRVEFHDSDGNRVSEGVDNVNNVEAGTRSPFNVTGFAHAKGGVTCEVATVRRTAVPGS